MVNVSDRNGRALEYIIANEFIKSYGFIPDITTLRNNERDFVKYENLPVELKDKFHTAAITISEYFYNQLGPAESYNIKRMDDNPNDPTDIIIIGSKDIKLSIKHNHCALKHPRPYSFAQACGFDKGSQEDQSFRKHMENITDTFRNNNKGIGLFPNCSAESKINLYNNIYQCCEQFINEHMSKRLINSLFNFILGFGFFKVIVVTKNNDNKILIEDFINLEKCNELKVYINDNRLILNFENKYIISLRVHNASSRISPKNQISLKFDAQLINRNNNYIYL